MDSLSQEVAIIVVGSSFFLLVAVGVIILVLVYQKKQLRYLLEKKELSNQFQKELLKTKLETQEQTLTQLSAELHDNVGQLLSSSKLLIGVAGRDASTSPESLRLADETISKAIFELRNLSKSLSTEWLEKFSFIENISAEAGRINACGDLQVSLNYPSTLALASEKQMLLFRMAQEALQNAIKHGKATHIRIKVTDADQGIQMIVEDNGKGFDTNDTTKQGIGMTNIQHRAQLMGGVAAWHSIGPGTTLSIQLPRSHEG